MYGIYRSHQKSKPFCGERLETVYQLEQLFNAKVFQSLSHVYTAMVILKTHDMPLCYALLLKNAGMNLIYPIL